MKKHILILINLLALFQLTAQKASIEVTVSANKSGETLPSVYVSLSPGEKKAATDIDGKVTFENLAAGTYTISLMSPDGEYQEKELTDIRLGKDEKKIIDIKLFEVESIGTVEIIHTIKRDGEVGAIDLQRKNLAMVEVISAEKIGKTSAKNVGDVIKLSSGASIQDNKFAIIRGLNDRYNAAFLNGTQLPSTESDRKAFAFDMFPSNMLDNLTISKTATADLPAEFAGGIIQINTRSIPEKSFIALSMGASYNTITTFEQGKTYNGSKTDILGFDNGTRSLPTAIPSQGEFPLSIHDQANLAKTFSTSWGSNDINYLPNQSLQLSGGYVTKIKDHKFGFIGALTYNRSYNFNTSIRRGFSTNSSNTGQAQMDFDYIDKNNTEQILSGAMLNIAYSLSPRTEISLKNMLSANSEDRLIERSGILQPTETNPFLLRSTALWYTSNKVMSSQLNLKHESLNEKWKLEATAGVSYVKRTVPNLRRSIYTRNKFINDPTDPNPLDTVYTASIGNTSIGPGYGGGMFFSENNEISINNRFDASYIVSENEEKRTGLELKAGLFAQNRMREFEARQLGYTRYGVSGGSIDFNDSLLYLGEDQIFAAENMGLLASGKGGFKLTDGTKNTDAYSASSNLYATYIQAHQKMNHLRLVFGLRAEYYQQKLNAILDNNDSLTINTTKLDLLPSLNAIYELDRKNIGRCRNFLRFSYSQTLNRPEYRELAPFAFFDFTTNFVLSGNDSLLRAKINNLDLRYEFYPGNGQLFTATAFFKHFTNPIEQISRADVTSETSYKNLPSAINYGFEIEARSQFSTFIKCDSNSFWNKLSVYGNIAIIRSVVNTEDVVGSISSSRQLQGQSPYVLNCGLQYQNPKHKWGANLNLNRVGERIAIVGNVNEPDLIENSRTFVDLQLTKTIWKDRLDFKFSVQNILAQDQVFYQNGTSNEKASFGRSVGSFFTGDKTKSYTFDENTDNQIWRTNFGRTISLSVSLKL